MQNLTAAPRDGLAAEQVERLLTGPDVEVSAGLELLDTSNRLVQDVSDDLVGGTVEHDNYASVHGSCRLQITRELAWGRDRVRPYMALSSRGLSARFNLGVYVLQTPNSPRGEDPITFTAAGSDLLYLLQDGPADTHVAAAFDDAGAATGLTYLQAVRDAIAASGIGAPLLIDGTLQDTPLPATMVWGLTTSGGASWLQIINDLLSAINYVGLYVDQDGNLRSEPYRDPATRASERTFDTDDDATNIVHPDRTLTEDLWGAPNWWKFVRTRIDTPPIEGDGLYLPDVNATDPAQTAVGRIVRKVVYLDAADQAALVEQGDKIVAEDQQATRSFALTIDPLPVLAHRDVVTLVDMGRSDKLPVNHWVLDLTGEPGRLDLGGDVPEVPQPTETQMSATVTSVAPLKVLIDGAETPCFANQLADDSGVLLTLGVGNRVSTTVRNPKPPLVQGIETT